MTGGDAPFIRIWDLRAVRAELARMGLDWAQREYPSALISDKPLRLHLDLRGAEGSPPPSPFYRQGLERLQAGQPKDAASLFIKVTDAFPTDPRGWRGRALAHIRMGQWEKAAADTARVGALGLDVTDLHREGWELVWARVQFGDADERRRLAKRLLERYEQSQNPGHLFLAVRTILLKPLEDPADMPRFLRMAERAATVEGGSGMLWDTLGLARLRAGDWKGAIEAYQKAAKAPGAPGTPAERPCLEAVALWHTGQGTEAIRRFNRSTSWMTANQSRAAGYPTTWRDSENFLAEFAPLLTATLGPPPRVVQEPSKKRP
jgi:tetratricopeptide (TPR) repeat protein